MPSSIYLAGGSKYILVPAAFVKELEISAETPVTLEIVSAREMKVKIG